MVKCSMHPASRGAFVSLRQKDRCDLVPVWSSVHPAGECTSFAASAPYCRSRSAGSARARSIRRSGRRPFLEGESIIQQMAAPHHRTAAHLPIQAARKTKNMDEISIN